jgi:acetylglutamate synthase
MGETVDGQILNVNADFAANELVKVLQPYKIVFLTGTGGLLDGEGRVIDSISLSSEYERLIAQPWLHSGMRLKIEQIKDLLDELPLDVVGIDHASGGTGQGAVYPQGFRHADAARRARAASASQWEQLDLARLRSLIESSFRACWRRITSRRTKPAASLRERKLSCRGDPRGR